MSRPLYHEHVAALDLRRIGLRPDHLVAGWPVGGDPPSGQASDSRLGTLLAAGAWLLLDGDPDALAVELGDLPDFTLPVERVPLAAPAVRDAEASVL